jgi:RHS repeat-associated protein
VHPKTHIGRFAAKGSEPGPYGSLLVASGTSAYDNPFRFSTKYADDETGLVYYGFRFYSTSLGGWASRDPTGAGIKVSRVRGTPSPTYDFSLLHANLRGFVINRPVDLVDPTGLANLRALGPRCCNVSGRNPEYAVVGNGQWRALAPGECTGFCEDCDGMTCNGAFYWYGGVGLGVGRFYCTASTPTAGSGTMGPRGWTPTSPGGNAQSPVQRGVPEEQETPPGYSWNPNQTL